MPLALPSGGRSIKKTKHNTELTIKAYHFEHCKFHHRLAQWESDRTIQTEQLDASVHGTVVPITQ